MQCCFNVGLMFLKLAINMVLHIGNKYGPLKFVVNNYLSIIYSKLFSLIISSEYAVNFNGP